MGKWREAVRVVVSLVATVAQFALLVAVAYVPFAWWERVKADAGDPDNETYFCLELFAAGHRTFPSAPRPVSCWNEAGDLSVVVTKQYRCDDGATLLANKYGWWSTEDTILRVPTDHGRPPRAALDDCLGR